MTSVTRLFSLVLALVAISAVNAYAIPRAAVDYRQRDVNIRIIETRSFPSVASSPRYIAPRRVRDFRVPRRLKSRQAPSRPPPPPADIPDVDPVLEEPDSANLPAASSSSTVSVPRKASPRGVTLPHPDTAPTLLPRNEAGLIQVNLLNTYYRDMRTHSRNLRMYPLFVRALFFVDDPSPGDYRRRARDSRDDPRFREDTVRELQGFRDNMDRAQGVLGDLGRDKGLANYDRNNDLETLLKDIVNLNKDTLSSVTDIVYEIPVLGPILGPSKCLQIPAGVLANPLPGALVVGELKCIIDEVLNAVENTVDGLLNSLGITAQWRNLRGEYVGALCRGRLELLGLCVGADLPGLGLRSDEDQ